MHSSALLFGFLFIFGGALVSLAKRDSSYFTTGILIALFLGLFIFPLSSCQEPKDAKVEVTKEKTEEVEVFRQDGKIIISIPTTK